jgi:PhnB protein
MAHFEPYLNFDGNCAEAMRFYEKTLGGKLSLMTFGGSPMAGQVPPGSADLIMHAHLDVGGRVLMGSDVPPGMGYKGVSGFMVSLTFDDVAEGQRIFETLAAGGKIHMPYGKTFWVEGFGMCFDRFGIGWIVNGGKPAMGPPQA